MVVGEQPGDEEDLSGKPFVGPAGRVLRRAFDDAGIDRAAIYVTNAVKHFSFEPRGTRRIHKTPAQREIEACRVWLDEEIDTVRPQVIVALGASALSALMRKRLAVGAARDVALTHPSGARVVATYHPSAVLRAPDEQARQGGVHRLGAHHLGEARPRRSAHRRAGGGGTRLAATTSADATSTTEPSRRSMRTVASSHDTTTPSTSPYPPSGSARRRDTRTPVSPGPTSRVNRAPPGGRSDSTAGRLRGHTAPGRNLQ